VRQGTSSPSPPLSLRASCARVVPGSSSQPSANWGPHLGTTLTCSILAPLLRNWRVVRAVGMAKMSLAHGGTSRSSATFTARLKHLVASAIV